MAHPISNPTAYSILDHASYPISLRAVSYIDENWVNANPFPDTKPEQISFLKNSFILISHFLKKHVAARGAHLLLVPGSFIECALLTIYGLGCGILALIPIGTNPDMSNRALKHLSYSNLLFSQCFLNFLRMINPGAKFSGIWLPEKPSTNTETTISARGNGFITQLVYERLQKWAKMAEDCYHSPKNGLQKHLITRFMFFTLALTLLLTRALDATISIPATLLAIFFFGKWESINNLSYRTLQATGIVRDLFYCTLKILHPGAKIYPGNSF